MSNLSCFLKNRFSTRRHHRRSQQTPRTRPLDSSTHTISSLALTRPLDTHYLVNRPDPIPRPLDPSTPRLLDSSTHTTSSFALTRPLDSSTPRLLDSSTPRHTLSLHSPNPTSPPTPSLQHRLFNTVSSTPSLQPRTKIFSSQTTLFHVNNDLTINRKDGQPQLQLQLQPRVYH